MVFRFAYKDYICIEPDTADRWEELGLAEILEGSVRVEKAEKPVQEFHPDYYGAPPPLLIGDNIYGIFPNVYTLRGSVYRDPMNYVNALDQMIQLEPKHVVASHVKPINDPEEAMDVLISTRDANPIHL